MLPDCLILAGGSGTRLRSVVSDRSKVLAPVRGRPFLTYVLDRVIAGRGRHVILAVGYMAEGIRAAIGVRYGPLVVQYAVEQEPLGTGGALASAARLVATADVLVLNGDSIILEDLGALARRHTGRQPAVTIVTVDVADTGPYGAIATDASGRVTAFAEKRGGGPGTISAGVYAIQTSVLHALPVPSSLEHDVLPGLVERGVVEAYPSTAPFIDMGTPDAYARLVAEAERYLPARGIEPHG